MSTGTKTRLRESVSAIDSSTAVDIDPNRPCLRNCKIAGLRSRNGHIYEESAYLAADRARMYEGVHVYVDHDEPSDPSKPPPVRGCLDQFGWFENTHFVPGDGERGDFFWNPKHAYSEQFTWLAEHKPNAVGFSQIADGIRITDRDGTRRITQITAVESVDLVTRAATTVSLRESYSMEDDIPPVTPDTAGGGGVRGAIKQAIMAILDDDTIPDDELKAKVMHALELEGAGREVPDDDETEEPAEEEEIRAEESLKRSSTPVFRKLGQKLTRLRESATGGDTTTRLRESCSQAGLTDVSESFLGTLGKAKTEGERTRLIEARREALANRPTSTQYGAGRQAGTFSIADYRKAHAKKQRGN